MPIYEYKCTVCNQSFQVLKPIERIDEKELCIVCGQPGERLISKPSRFKRGQYWSLGEQEDMPGEI